MKFDTLPVMKSNLKSKIIHQRNQISRAKMIQVKIYIYKSKKK